MAKRIPSVNFDMIRIGTHIPVLVRAFTLSEGDVAEFGGGYFSTAILRWLCEMSGRTLYTYEHMEYWYRKAIRNPVPFHNVIFVENWDKIKIERPWGLAFIDHDPVKRRSMETKRLANYAEYIVIHDTEPAHDFDKKYKYGTIWPLFKYRYDFRLYFPNTSVVSNFNSLEKFDL